MKQIFLLSVFALLVFAGFIIQDEPQKLDSKEVPEAVIYSFNTTFPLINVVNWVKDSDYYEARYDARFHKYSAVFDRSGKLIATGIQIGANNLPQVIKNFVSINYPGLHIKKTTKVLFADNRISYEIIINEKILLLDEYGKILNAKITNN